MKHLNLRALNPFRIPKNIVTHLLQGNWYSLRRAYVWPEAAYKRGLLRRVQTLYKLPYFVETGTFQGSTPKSLHSLFERLWTIELDDSLFERTRRRLKAYPNVVCLHGDGKEELKKVIPLLDGPAPFWLDGHYSGLGTAKGEISAPLLEELSIVMQSPIKGHVIAIDDMSDFCQRERNTPLSKIMAALEQLDPNYKFYFDYDMLFALPNEKVHREFWRKIAYPVVIR
jgi:hypothetical protein